MPPDNNMSFEREVLDRLIKIEAKLESWDTSKKQIYESQKEILLLQEDNKRQQECIDEISDNNKWLFRTTVAAVIVTSLNIVTSLIQSGAIK